MLEVYKELLDVLFAKYADQIVDCEASRGLVAENVDGVNLTLDHFETVLKELVADGSILAKPSAQQIQEAQWQRDKEERARKFALADDHRALRKMPREQWELEMKKRRAVEAKANQEAVASETKKLTDMSVEELRKKVHAEELARGKRPSSIRSGAQADIW